MFPPQNAVLRLWFKTGRKQDVTRAQDKHFLSRWRSTEEWGYGGHAAECRPD